MSENAINQKRAIVDEIKDKIQRSKAVVIVDYKGLTVAEATELRNKFRAAGVDFKVYKNTLVKRAADELGISGLDTHLEGPSAFIFGYNDPVMPAKIINEFLTKANKGDIKGGVMDNAVIDKTVVKKLADLPTKEVLLTRFMWALTSSVRGFAVALNAVKEQKEKMGA